MMYNCGPPVATVPSNEGDNTSLYSQDERYFCELTLQLHTCPSLSITGIKRDTKSGVILPMSRTCPRASCDQSDTNSTEYRETLFLKGGTLQSSNEEPHAFVQGLNL
eukprot:1139570-Pleurochrysis_carterae.AAC.2